MCNTKCRIMTTIEWLRKELETIPNYSAFYTNNYTWIDSIMNEAKEMEKQQMKMAQMHYSSDVVGFKTLLENQFEDWYNQTFKSE